jgi:hypothetical protein
LEEEDEDDDAFDDDDDDLEFVFDATKTNHFLEKLATSGGSLSIRAALSLASAVLTHPNMRKS